MNKPQNITSKASRKLLSLNPFKAPKERKPVQNRSHRSRKVSR